MITRFTRLLSGAATALAAALLTAACGQPGSSPVSPSSMAPGSDGSAVKGMLNFCAYIRAHEMDPVYVVGQPVGLSTNVGDEPVWEVSPPPHGLVCFSVPTSLSTVYLTIEPSFRNAAGEGYCSLDDAPFAVHRAPSTIWLFPDDGTHPNCHYSEGGPF